MNELESAGEIVLRPIGSVFNEVNEVKQMRGAWAEIVSEVRLAREFAPGLERLDGFSHALVVYWKDQVAADRRRAVGAPGVGSAGPPAGTFALRTPNRPNPIGVSTVQLLRIRENILEVTGLDAVSGTPVLDIKPYSVRHDLAAEPVLPDWARRLW
ncbi:MAG: tRNA (N6-threonylcarbamoyladenosine(37)-N6)-methyltransferase TrmO [Dehalococcoidia bacterium]